MRVSCTVPYLFHMGYKKLKLFIRLAGLAGCVFNIWYCVVYLEKISLVILLLLSYITFIYSLFILFVIEIDTSSSSGSIVSFKL